MKKYSILLIILILIFFFFLKRNNDSRVINDNQNNVTGKQNHKENPLSIYTMRNKDYPGSDLIIETQLESAYNYDQFIASYKSEGYKIYGLLTIPTGNKPKNGWPVIIFNHGYIPPEQYSTTQRYGAYVDTFARNGYIVFKPDYRGNGNSEGSPEGAYYSSAYATDVLNAVATFKKYEEADSNKIGMWGHSMGGNIILRDIVVNTKDIKATVVWAGVLGSYYDLINNWRRQSPFQPSQKEQALRKSARSEIVKQYGYPSDNSSFWKSIDPTYFLSDVNTPIQLHAGENDKEVPMAFSESLHQKLTKLDKTVEYYSYPQEDHKISGPYFDLAMQRSIKFFDKYLKG